MSARAALHATVALVAASAVACSLQAQTSRSDPVDLQTWYGTGVRIDLANRWTASVKYRARMVDNGAEYRGSYVTGELEYEPRRWLAMFGGYRLGLLEDAMAHRYTGGAELSRKLGGTSISLRQMLQHQRSADEDDGGTGDRDSFARTRLEAKRPLGRRVSVYGSVEPSYRVGGSYRLDSWRNTLGVEIEYGREREVDLFYIHRPDYAKRYDRTIHVIGVNLDFRLKGPHRGR